MELRLQSLDWICLAPSLFFLNWVIHSVPHRRRAGLRGATGEHLASEGHGGSAGVLFNEVEDEDAQCWGGVGGATGVQSVCLCVCGCWRWR